MGFSWDTHKKQVIAGAAVLLAAGVLAASASAVGGGSDGKAPVVMGRQYDRPVTAAPETTVAPPPPAPPATEAPKPTQPQQPTATKRQRTVTTQGPTTTIVRPGRDGYHLEAAMSSAGTATTADLVRFAISVTGNAGKVDGVLVDFGDGTTGRTPVPAAPSCSKDRGPSDAAFEINHRFARPGTYGVRIVAIDVACGERVTFDQQPMMVKINQGAVRSNGPAQPTSTDCIANPAAFCMHDTGDGRGRLDAFVADADGYVQAVIIDWGHHQIEAVRFPTEECRTGADGFPSSHRSVNADHQFPERGTYRVTMKVVSSGCDGHDVQESTFVKDITV